ncbi:MAG: histidine kinase N-terminal 7TM domain-containing protein [Nitrospirales bacterium]
MELFALSGLLNGLAALGLTVFIYFRAPQDPRHWSFGLVGLSTAVWSFGYFAWQLASTEVMALYLLRLLMAGAIFIPIAFLHHVTYLLNTYDVFQSIIKANYLIGIVFLILDFTPYFVQDVQAISIFPFWGIPGFGFHICLIWWFGLVILTEWFLFQAYQKEKGIRRRQILNIMVGSAIGFLGGATNFPLWYGIEILPYGTVAFTLYISLVAYALLRFHWLDFSVYVERGLSYFTLLLLISQPVYPVLLLAQKSFLGSINLRFSLIQLLAHIFTLVGAYHMKVGSKGALARTILKGRELKVHNINKFSSKVSSLQSLDQLGTGILETLGKGIGASQAAVFVLKHHENHYRVVSSFGFPENHSALKQGWAFSDDLPQMLMFHQNRVVLEELKMSRVSDQWEQEIARQFEQLEIEWCFPFFSNSHLLGFLVIGPIDREFFHILGGEAVWNTIIQEATLALENAVLRDEVLRSQKLLCQADRIRSLEIMTNGLTRELDYPLGSMKAFVQMAGMRRNSSEFAGRLQDVVGQDLANLKQLSQEIRGYVTQVSHSFPTSICVEEVIDSCLLFFSHNPVYHSVMVEKNYLSPIPKVLIDRQGLIQAVFNGLLFLLKSKNDISGTLQVDILNELQLSDKRRVEIRIAWKGSPALIPLSSLSLEGETWEETLENLSNSSLFQGLVVGSRILQQYSADFRILTAGDVIWGFQIQLPIGPVPAGGCASTSVLESSISAKFSFPNPEFPNQQA